MIKKPDRAESFKPKCLLTDRQLHTATGFIVLVVGLIIHGA